MISNRTFRPLCIITLISNTITRIITLMPKTIIKCITLIREIVIWLLTTNPRQSMAAKWTIYEVWSSVLVIIMSWSRGRLVCGVVIVGGGGGDLRRWAIYFCSLGCVSPVYKLVISFWNSVRTILGKYVGACRPIAGELTKPITKGGGFWIMQIVSVASKPCLGWHALAVMVRDT